MVNVYIIHSGKDYDYVKSTVEPILMGKTDENGNPGSGECNANVLTLESGVAKSWKMDAKKKIRMAQVVIVVIGADANEPSKSATMGWEVKQATKKNKQIMMIKLGKYQLPDYLFHTDRFTSQKMLLAKPQSISEIKKRIDDFAKGRYTIFSQKYSEMATDEKAAYKTELVEQYMMFQKSSEDLVTRRQNLNSFYISVNSALVALMGIVFGIVDMPAKILALFFMCLSGIILDISWIRILNSYGILNASKMKVINLLEEQLPVTLYAAEWRVMSDKLNNKKYISFTDSETAVPKIFVGIYIAVTLATAIVYVISLFKP